MKRPQFEASVIRLRECMSDALDALQGLAQLDVNAPALREHIKAFTDSAGLRVTIAGGEGVGKSSLVNGLVGRKITPEEGRGAGTAVPVVLHYGAGHDPVFELAFKEGASRRVTPDEFARHVLQFNNPANVLGVKHGVVALHAPLLSDGLVLMDTPGIRGADTVIREEIGQLIAQGDYHLLGICADREYAPLLEIILKSRLAPERVVGVVDAVSKDFFPDTEEKSRKRIEERREAIRDVFAHEGVELSPARIFVVHLPSLSQVLRHEAPALSLECHRAEVHALRDRLQAAAADFDFGPLFRQAVDASLEALQPLEVELGRRALLWKGAMKRQSPEGEAFSTALVEAEAEMRMAWDGFLRRPNIAIACKSAEALLAKAAAEYVSAAEEALAKAAHGIDRTMWFRTASLDDQVQGFDRKIHGAHEAFLAQARLAMRKAADAVLAEAEALFAGYEARLPLFPPSRPRIALSDDDLRLVESAAQSPVAPPPECRFNANWLSGKSRRKDAMRRVAAAIRGWDHGQAGCMQHAVNGLVSKLKSRLMPAFEQELFRRQAAFDAPPEQFKAGYCAFAAKETAFAKALKILKKM